jgi:hypothetical protein
MELGVGRRTKKKERDRGKLEKKRDRAMSGACHISAGEERKREKESTRVRKRESRAG